MYVYVSMPHVYRFQQKKPLKEAEAGGSSTSLGMVTKLVFKTKIGIIS